MACPLRYVGASNFDRSFRETLTKGQHKREPDCTAYARIGVFFTTPFRSVFVLSYGNFAIHTHIFTLHEPIIGEALAIHLCTQCQCSKLSAALLRGDSRIGHIHSQEKASMLHSSSRGIHDNGGYTVFSDLLTYSLQTPQCRFRRNEV